MRHPLQCALAALVADRDEGIAAVLPADAELRYFVLEAETKWRMDQGF